MSAPGAGAAAFGDPALAVNGVRGGGRDSGGSDVFSLGYRAGVDDSLTVRWSGRLVQNGPGPDFVVFENAFAVNGSSERFMDQAVVSLSRDGVSWAVYPHRYAAPDPTRYSRDPSLWPGFAGVNYVLYQEGGGADPFDAERAGGDAFDLDQLGDDGAAGDIKRHGFRFLKLVSAPAVTNPDTGAGYVHDPASNGPDIDGVYGRYFAEDAP